MAINLRWRERDGKWILSTYIYYSKWKLPDEALNIQIVKNEICNTNENKLRLGWISGILKKTVYWLNIILIMI